MTRLAIVAMGLVFLSVAAFAAPVANNQNASKVGPGNEILFSLSYNGVPTSFTIVSNPGHGALQSYNSRNGYTQYPSYYYYKATNAVYEGPDSFTWKKQGSDGS